MKTAIKKTGKICALIVLFLIPLVTVFVVKFNKQSFNVNAEVYQVPPPLVDAPCPHSPCFRTDPGNPANGCPAPATTCHGTVGGLPVIWYQDANGDWWYNVDISGPEDPDPPEPPVPTPPIPPPPGQGRIQVYALTAPADYLQTCSQLALVKTCIDSPGSAGCIAITGSIDYLDNTKIYLSGGYPVIQTDHTGVLYTNVLSNFIYWITATHPSGNYSPYITCNKSTLNPVNLVWQIGSSFYLYPNDTTTVLVGLGSFFPWFQVTGGGNTYGETITSMLPLMTDPTLLFDTTSAPTSPGILSVLLEYDLADSLAYRGNLNISSKNWNVKDGRTAKNWYTFFKHRLSQGTILPYPPGSVGKPSPVAGTVIYTTGNLTINQEWNIANGEKLIVIVEGTLNIMNHIHIAGNGFVGFVVRDDIIIDKTVGTRWNENPVVPVVEGMYIAGNRIMTGHSTDANTERFVGKGIFMANEIILGRDLSTTGNNKDTSADLFLYNPAFLVTTPDILKNLSFEWQEVVP